MMSRPFASTSAVRGSKDMSIGSSVTSVR
jgi:hypothetical protein